MNTLPTQNQVNEIFKDYQNYEGNTYQNHILDINLRILRLEMFRCPITKYKSLTFSIRGALCVDKFIDHINKYYPEYTAKKIINSYMLNNITIDLSKELTKELSKD